MPWFDEYSPDVGSPVEMIDLFAGAGGLTSGFVSTGRFRPVAAVESDLHAAATYAHNFGDHVYVGDIADWVEGSMPRAQVVVGGPPCQGFSALGKRNVDDPRNVLWRHYMAVIRRVRPAFFVLENVPNFLKSDQFALLLGETRSAGLMSAYALEPHVLVASDYGVAQNRRRAVVVGRLRELPPLGPPEPVESLDMQSVMPPWLTPQVARTALPESTTDFRAARVPGVFKLQDLHFSPPPSALSLSRYQAIPPGGSRLDLPEGLKMRCWTGPTTGSGDVMGRLRWDRPSVTIRTEFFKPEKGRYLHPDEHRAITHAEAAIIQGFPEDFEWCGNRASTARQIGNAVPPPMGAAIARHLAERIV